MSKKINVQSTIRLSRKTLRIERTSIRIYRNTNMTYIFDYRWFHVIVDFATRLILIKRFRSITFKWHDVYVEQTFLIIYRKMFTTLRSIKTFNMCYVSFAQLYSYRDLKISNYSRYKKKTFALNVDDNIENETVDFR